jgi:hypothetical protein
MLDVCPSPGDTDFMFYPFHPSKCLTLMLCLFVAVMRLTGAHMHYCLDGMEPPISMHFDGVGAVHHADEHHAAEHDHRVAHEHSHSHSSDEQFASEHSDIDVSLFADVLAKKTDVAFLFVLSCLVVLLLVPPRILQRIRLVAIPIPIGRSWAISPPVRGPPRFSHI